MAGVGRAAAWLRTAAWRWHPHRAWRRLSKRSRWATGLLLAVIAVTFALILTPRKLTLSAEARSETVAIQLADCAGEQVFLLPPGQLILNTLRFGPDGLPIEPKPETYPRPVVVSVVGPADLRFGLSERGGIRLTGSFADPVAAEDAARRYAVPRKSWKITIRSPGKPDVSDTSFGYDAIGSASPDAASPQPWRVAARGEFVVGAAATEVNALDDLALATSPAALTSGTVRGHDKAWISQNRFSVLEERLNEGDRLSTADGAANVTCSDAAWGMLSLASAGSGDAGGYTIILHASRRAFTVMRGGGVPYRVGASWLESFVRQTAIQFAWAALLVLGAALQLGKGLFKFDDADDDGGRR